MTNAVKAYERINAIYDQVESQLNQNSVAILDGIKSILQDPESYDKRAQSHRITSGFQVVNRLFEYLQNNEAVTVLSHHNAKDSFIRNYVPNDCSSICETFRYLKPEVKTELESLIKLWILMDDLVDVHNVKIHELTTSVPDLEPRKAFYEKEIKGVIDTDNPVYDVNAELVEISRH